MEQVTKDKLGFLSPTPHSGDHMPLIQQEYCTYIPAYEANIIDLLIHTTATIDQVGNISYVDAFTHWLTSLPSQPLGNVHISFASLWLLWDTNWVLLCLQVLPEGS